MATGLRLTKNDERVCAVVPIYNRPWCNLVSFSLKERGQERSPGLSDYSITWQWLPTQAPLA